MHGNIDHFEEIVSVVEPEISKEINQQLSIEKREGKKHEDESINRNNSNPGTLPIDRSPADKIENENKGEIETLPQVSEISDSYREHDVKQTGLERSSESKVDRSNSNLKLGLQPTEMEPCMIPYGYDAVNPYYMYGQYIAPYPSSSGRHQHPDYPYFSPLTNPGPPESARMLQKSPCGTWTPSSIYSEHGYNIQRSANHTVTDCGASLRRYPYNPEFRGVNQQECKTSSNPLIAAYQQQNVDIPKGHIQVISVENI